MVAVNFRSQLADAVESGEKYMTIRPTARCKVGDNLQLYTGQRTKGCRKLRDGVCATVAPIQITTRSIVLDGYMYGMGTDMAGFIAKSEGFETMSEMLEFFDRLYGLPFEGCLIEWRPA